MTGADGSITIDTKIDTSGVNKGMKDTANAVKEAGKKITNMLKRAFIFSYITKGISALKKAFSKLIESNAEASAAVAELKGALYTLAAPLLNTVLPIFVQLVQFATQLVTLMASGMSKLFGTTLSQSAEDGQTLADSMSSTSKSASKVKRTLAGIDELNVLSDSSSSSSSSGTGVTTKTYSAQDLVNTKTFGTGIALLAIGAVLTFTGWSIPIGVALMAAGGLALYGAVSQSEGLDEETKEKITKLATIVGGALIAIGVMLLLFTPVWGLGFGLVAAGVAAMITAVAINKGGATSETQNQLTSLARIVGGALFVLGVLALLFGQPAIGIGLMIAGGAMYAATVDWNFLLTKVKGIWSSITSWFSTNVAPKLTLSYWQTKFSNIATGLKNKIKDGINAAIVLFNKFIDWLNDKMNITWTAKKVLGQTVIPAGNIQLLNLKHIPQLASGSVVPRNNPYLAMLGDNKQEEEVVSPLSTMKEALTEALNAYGGQTVVVNIDGQKLFEIMVNQNNNRVRTTGMSPLIV